MQLNINRLHVIIGPKISGDIVLTYYIVQNQLFTSKEETCELKGFETDENVSRFLPH